MRSANSCSAQSTVVLDLPPLATPSLTYPPSSFQPRLDMQLCFLAFSSTPHCAFHTFRLTECLSFVSVCCNQISRRGGGGGSNLGEKCLFMVTTPDYSPSEQGSHSRRSLRVPKCLSWLYHIHNQEQRTMPVLRVLHSVQFRISSRGNGATQSEWDSSPQLDQDNAHRHIQRPT